MKHNGRKLVSLALVLAMLLSFVAVAEDGLTDLGMDQPIEIEGKVGNEGDTQAPEGELEIDMDEAEGLPDGEVDPEGGEELDLSLDLDGEGLESNEEELAPATEEAMMAAGGTSESDAIEIGSWSELVAAMVNDATGRSGESADKPTFYKLIDDVTCPSGGSAITVEQDRHVVLDLNGKKIDRGLTSPIDYGYVIKVEGDMTINDSAGGGKITGGNNSKDGYGDGGGGVMVTTSSGKFTLNSGTITGNKAALGGGVFVGGSNDKTTFTMNGGTITGNEAPKGSGVYIYFGTFNMQKGAITGNEPQTGGGVYMYGGTFNLSGNVDISGNSKNVLLGDSGKKITIAGEIEVDVDKPIGVSYADSFTDESRDFTKDFGKITGHDADWLFTSEQTGYAVFKNDSSEQTMLAKAWTITFESNEGTGDMKPLTVRQEMPARLTDNAFARPGYRFTGWNTAADGTGDAYTDGQGVEPTADITLYAQWEQIEVEVEAFDSKGYEYTGKAIEPEVVVKDKKTGKALVKGTDYEVEYRNNVNAGDPAQAYILMKGDYEGVDVPVKNFKITPKPITVTAKNLTKAQGDKDPELTYTVDGLVEGDAMKGELAREEGEKPGTYKIKRGTLTAGSNYDIVKFTEGTLTIKAKSDEDKPQDEDKPTAEGDIKVKTAEDVPEMKMGGLTDETARDLATKEELERVEKGEKLVVYLTATNIDDTVSADDKRLVTAAITAKDKGGKVAQYLDFSMYKQVGSDKPTELHDLKGHKIMIIITVPKAFRAPAGVKRTFYVVRVHDGEAQIVGSGTGNSVKVSTDKFSTYALTYVDETAPTAKPEAKADYTLLGQLTVSGSGKTALKLSWTKVKDADGYDVFFARCGKNFKLKATLGAAESRCVGFTGLKKRVCYKAYVRAWHKVDGKKVYIGKKSPELHAITGGYDKDHCNTKSVKLSRSTLSLKVGKSKTIKATLKGVKSGRKPLDHARKVRWYSSNTSVATVDKNGKVKAVGKGSCTVYAVANNGIRSSVKVTVK